MGVHKDNFNKLIVCTKEPLRLVPLLHAVIITYLHNTYICLLVRIVTVIHSKMLVSMALATMYGKIYMRGQMVYKISLNFRTSKYHNKKK